LKTSNCGVVRLKPRFSLLLITIAFRLQNCEVFTFEDYDEQILLVTERIFCNNTKANGKILFCFCRVNQGANLRFGLQKYVLTAAFYSSLK